MYISFIFIRKGELRPRKSPLKYIVSHARKITEVKHLFLPPA